VARVSSTDHCADEGFLGNIHRYTLAIMYIPLHSGDLQLDTCRVRAIEIIDDGRLLQ
jgi:hypothetical protein